MMMRVEHVHMARTLTRRKRWVSPHGTICWLNRLDRSCVQAAVYGTVHTMSIIVEIEELIVPLCHDPDSIFNECANYEKTSYSWDISAKETQVSTAFNRSCSHAET